MNKQTIFTVGTKIGDPIHIIALAGTYEDIENEGSSLNTGAGHEAEDGDLLVEENDGTMIAYRIPDLSGTTGTAIVGDQSFDLSRGRCFILTPEYSAKQVPYDDPAIANSHHTP